MVATWLDSDIYFGIEHRGVTVRSQRLLTSKKEAIERCNQKYQAALLDGAVTDGFARILNDAGC